jgi:hypothetical protein
LISIKTLKTEFDAAVVFKFWMKNIVKRIYVGNVVTLILGDLHDTDCAETGLHAAFPHQFANILLP